MEEQKITEKNESETGSSATDETIREFLSYIGICIVLALSYFFSACQPIRDFVRQFSTVDETKIQSFVGMNSTDIRAKLGKPDRVVFRSNSSPFSNSNKSNNRTNSDGNGSTNNGVEIWTYYGKVPHKASGLKRNLELEIQDGICKTVELP